MNHITRLAAPVILAALLLIGGSWLMAYSPAPAVPLSPSPTDYGAVPSPTDYGAVPAPSDGAVPANDGEVPAPSDGAVPATDPTADDPDALPGDAPRVCVLLDMGLAACESFVNPPQGEVSVAVIYSDDDEHAIVETIAYDEHGPIDYVDFWEGETTPSE